MQRIIFVSLLSAFFFVTTGIKNTNADLDPHIVINEIQIAGASSNDEFIELFNPSDAPIDLAGYKLTKRTKTGTSESALVSTTKFSGIIQARGYFLIAHPNYKDKISADLSYSSSTYYISSDNTVFLYDKEGILLDRIGFGAVNYSENSPAKNPDANQSIERTDFIDTDNNAADFSVNISPSPQNSSITEDDDEESPGDDDPPYIPDSCTTLSQDIRLNEIFPYPNAGEEFVEIVNTGKDCADVSGWKIMDEAGHKKEFPANSILGPGEYLFLEGNLYLNNDSDTVYLLGKDGNAKEDALDSRNFEKAQKGLSYIFNGKGWSWTSVPTPSKENVIAAEESEENTSDTNSGENYSSAENVYLNEILPNPKKDSDGEYIEIVNGDSGPVDLRGWMIRDASKSGKYVFKEHTEIGPGEYLAIYKSESKIALNNSKESVYLHNPQGKITSSVSYEKSQKDASLNFDGKKWPARNASRSDAGWKWSKYLTPGKKNKFDSEPSVKIKKIKQTYKDIYTEFSAKAKDKETKKLKFSWDFGDGKKSGLQKTSHRYLDTGKYTVTLSVSDDSQTVEKSFALAVKKYPQPDLEITKILPNPVGNDSDGETIDVKNNSGKKVDIQDWKIASGSGDKIYNHPISDEISLGPNETKTITREISKFSFNNRAGKVQLISPDGKIVDVVEYSKDPPDSLRDSKRAGKIAEGEAYTKIAGEWQWIAPSAPAKTGDSQETSDSEDTRDEGDEVFDEQPDGEILGATDENVSYFAPNQTRYTPEDKFIFFKIFGLLEYQPREANFCPTIQPANTLAYF